MSTKKALIDAYLEREYGRGGIAPRGANKQIADVFGVTPEYVRQRRSVLKITVSMDTIFKLRIAERVKEQYPEGLPRGLTLIDLAAEQQTSPDTLHRVLKAIGYRIVFLNEEHGNRSRYAKGCRCFECVAANVAVINERRSRMVPEDAPKHGTQNAFVNYRCRCRACKDAQNEYTRPYKQAWAKRQRDKKLAEAAT